MKRFVRELKMAQTEKEVRDILIGYGAAFVVGLTLFTACVGMIPWMLWMSL